MAIIGNFTKQDNAYQGTIATLSVSAKVTITPIEKTGEQSPDFRVFGNKAEIGGPGSQRARRATPTSRSSSTIRASRHRSSAAWWNRRRVTP
jgi:uncharacterized protein (DUF736 family)